MRPGAAGCDARSAGRIVMAFPPLLSRSASSDGSTAGNQRGSTHGTEGATFVTLDADLATSAAISSALNEDPITATLLPRNMSFDL